MDSIEYVASKAELKTEDGIEKEEDSSSTSAGLPGKGTSETPPEGRVGADGASAPQS